MTQSSLSLKRLRHALGLNQQQMAEVLGVALHTLSRFEAGVFSGPPGSVPSALRTAMALVHVAIPDVPKVLAELLALGAEPHTQEIAAEVERHLDVLTHKQAPHAKLLGDLLQTPTTEREPQSFCYWATHARASLKDTLALATKHHVICRLSRNTQPWGNS